MLLKLLIPVALATAAYAAYVPGTPGGDWTQEEADIVKEKLEKAWETPKRYLHDADTYMYDPQERVDSSDARYYAKATKALRMIFHDCLKYADGTGGCDGCMNFDQNGTNVETDNNGLQYTAAILEKVYKDENFPKGSSKLETSLFDSGKSRADLWAFAGLVSVNYFARVTNEDCGKGDQSAFCNGRINGNFTNCAADISALKFQTGRADCVTDDPIGYVTKATESHPNQNGNGDQTIEFFRNNFGFTMRESVAIMGAHTIGKFNNPVSGFLYSWTREGESLLNNEYYRLISKKPEYALHECIGDVDRNPAETDWDVLAEGKGSPPYNGRLIWFHKYTRCPDCISKPSFEKSKFKSVGGLDYCCSDLEDGQQCKPECVKRVQKDETAMSSEMGFYYKFDIDQETLEATGCPGFDNWHFKGMTTPDCPLQDMITEEGIPLHEVVEEYAEDGQRWLDDFLATLTKMLSNGYTTLNDGPRVNDA